MESLLAVSVMLIKLEFSSKVFQAALGCQSSSEE
jgi:hypothetical protein